MNTIMFVLLAVFAVCCIAVTVVFLSGPIMFRMGIRNIGRRRAQSVLVISGLMLATIIITASFATGDTVDYGATKLTYDNLQRTDLSLHHFQSVNGAPVAGAADQFYANQEVGARLTQVFAADPDIEGFIPFLFEPVPAMNPRTKLAEPGVMLAGIDVPALERFGGLRLADGRHADLAALREGQVFANERAVDKMDIRTGDKIEVYIQGQAVTLEIAGIVREERASGALEFLLSQSLPGLAGQLSAVQAVTGHVGQVNNVSVVLKGGVRGTLARSEPAAKRLEAMVATDEGKRQMGLGTAGFQVERIKQDAVDGAKLFASLFTTIFLVLGLFSIASGVLLIFMIFVMLAAERRQEMGITRAVGAERKHLVQAFLAEGMVYDLFAGLIGVVLGLFFALVVVVGGVKLIFGEGLAFIEPHVAPRSLVVSFCLGAVLTFITVVASALYVSRLNIVAAIRGQVESGTREPHRGRSVRWIAISTPLLVVLPPLGLYWLLRRGFGLSLTWTLAPLGGVLGVFLLWAGRATGSSFLFSTGISVLPIAAALLFRYYKVNGRVTWTGVGILLSLYWLMPFDLSEKLFGKFDNSGMEMFVLSGIMIVASLTLIIIFNARLISAIYAGASHGRKGYLVGAGLFGAVAVLALLGYLLGDTGGGTGDIAYLFAIIVGVAGAFSLVAQRFPGLAPALKMGIAYPIANRFRTGMTIAMFSLILFSLTVMSVINASFLQLFAGDEARGGWDLVIDTNKNNPIDDLSAALKTEGTFDAGQISAAGRLTGIDDDRQTVRQPGQEKWQRFIVRGADDAFWGAMEAKLESRARGFADDRAVFDAIRTNPKFAVIDAAAMATNTTFAAPGFLVKGVQVQDSEFDPFDVEIRNEATGQVGRVTVIGALSARIPQGLLPGLLISEQANREIFGASYYANVFVRLRPGADSERVTKQIKAALVTQGVQAYSIKKEIDDSLSISRNFLRLMQAFMGLGLFVGIAAVGVISLRSVVERRQQIGMLRAIGYEKHTVALSFLFETAFVALMGVGSGVVGALVLSRNLMSSPDFTGTEGLSLFVPWPEVIVFSLLACVFSLLMTWWPSRQAASVPIAEALRYE
jgi:putative ABC transport system permease protein